MPSAVARPESVSALGVLLQLATATTVTSSPGSVFESHAAASIQFLLSETASVLALF